MLKAEIIGHIGADAIVKESNGSKFISFRVAHSDRFKNQSGEDREQTTWVDVTMPESKENLVPYLKAGQMVYVRGFLSLRVYSSKQERMMKAGASIAAQEVEFCGGSSDDVPRRLIDPETAQIYNTKKYYWVGVDTSKLKNNEGKILISERGAQFIMNKQGFVSQAVPVNESTNQDK